MRIDYSINPNSKFFLLTDVSLRQSVNHLGLAIKGQDYGLSITERVKHLALGILKLIPVLGHIATLIDTLLQRKTITHLKFTSTDPFTRGEEHGRILKKRIKEIYDPILAMKGKSPTLQMSASLFELQIPNDLKEEMKGMAKGSGYSYEDILLIHTFLDAQPGEFGCTSMAVKETARGCQRIAAANHLVDSSVDAESCSRRQAILSQTIPLKGFAKEVLKAPGKDFTIQAMVFDTLRGEIYLSSQGTYAANGKFKMFAHTTLFNSQKFNAKPLNSQVRLFRNLDWPWYFLGQETVVLTRPHANGNSTASISWPGYIGTLSGMNNNGLAMAGNQCGNEVNLEGIPNPLLFTHMLDTCKDTQEVSQMLRKGQHGSAMNLVVADKTSARSYELKGNGGFSCVGEID